MHKALLGSRRARAGEPASRPTSGLSDFDHSSRALGLVKSKPRPLVTALKAESGTQPPP